MANFQVIDPQSLSYDNVKNDLVTYVQNLPDAAKWKDFYESGAGTTQIELLAGLGTFLGFHSLGARRESYLDSCRLYTSAVNLCNIIGYPVNRISAPRLRITFSVSLNTFWDRTDPCFYYKERGISLLHSQTIAGGTHTLDFVVGDWKSSSFISTTNDKFVNTLILDTGIDANLFEGTSSEETLGKTIELYINEAPVQLITYADQFLPENVLLRTYSGGVLLIFGDGYIGRLLRVNDSILLNYVNTEGPLDVIGLEPDSLTKALDCKILSVEVLNPGYVADSIPKMAAVAPGYLTSKRRMVTGPDHSYIFMNYSGSLISANYKKETGDCCTILLSYLFVDEHLASVYEKESMYNYLFEYKMVGERLVIVDPVLVGIEMKMVCIVEERTGQVGIEDTIKEIVGKYTMKLGTTFHIGQITSEVSRQTGVSRVYLVRPVSDKILEFEKYLKLVSLEVIVTANKDYVVEIDPNNNGYWRFLDKSVVTGLSEKRLMDTSAHFTWQSFGVGSLIVNPDLFLSAHVTEVISDTEVALDRDIFTLVGQRYEIYDVNV